MLPIPVSELTVLGTTPAPDGTNIYSGVVWKKTSDHQTFDATVTATRSCYSFDATAAKDRLVIQGMGSSDLNGKTTVVWWGRRSIYQSAQE
jgi:hypothetical protein